MDDIQTIVNFLETVHPYDSLPPDELLRVADRLARREVTEGETIYRHGERLVGLYLVKRGSVEVLDPAGEVISVLGARNSFGERGLLRDGRAATTARAASDGVLLMLPADEFRRLFTASPAVERFFTRRRSQGYRASDLTTQKVVDLMARKPVICAPGDSIRVAAMKMRDAGVSSLGVVEGESFLGIVTTRDMTNKVVAVGLDPATPVSEVMARDPVSLSSDALGSDILHLMLERRIGHLPVVDEGRLVGMITQTDLTRFQAVSAAQLVRDAATAESVADLAAVTARIPKLLVHLVSGHASHEVVTRLVTDIADAVTRRLLVLAEEALGPSPVAWCWCACGSQGRQEQTSATDQDNCLILSDAALPSDEAYFAAFAAYVCEGLAACGYALCPGEMMAITPRWRQPLRVWRQYFADWIDRPDPTAQMLSSVMFDLRPIGGDATLFDELQHDTLGFAAKSSIFVAHMVSSAIRHAPPLGLLRGFSTIRSGEHRNHIDLKMNGVVPVIDLGRVYALIGELEPANTRARLMAAEHAGVVSVSGARDLIEAYDMIALTRLENQARLIRAGRAPDNFMAPSDLSDFEQSHLRDAFVVVRTMQSALGAARGSRI